MAEQNISGARELDEMLKTLAAKVEKNIMRSALRAGAMVIRDEAKSNVPVLNGLLKKSIKVSGGSKGGVVTASVKVDRKKAPHGHLVEFGTRAHRIEPKNAEALVIAGAAFRSVEHPGARPQPFIRPAFDTKSAEAIDAIAAQIRKRLTAEGLNTPAPEVT